MRTLRIPENIGDFLEYDESSPSGLRWKVDRGGTAKAGKPAGSLAPGRGGRKVWQTKVISKNYLCCRLIWRLVHGEDVPVGKVIDHRDGDPLNNRIGNLRAVSQAINTRNRARNRNSLNATEGVTLVSQNKVPRARFIAHAHDGGKQLFKSFSIHKYGEAEALNLATTWRQQKLLELNAQGAGYSTRHLKNSGVQL